MNNKSGNPSLREQLLSQEKNNPQFQKSFRQEIKKMYVEKLKLSQRFAYLLTCFFIGIIALAFWAFKSLFEELQIKYELIYAEHLRLASTWAMFLSMALIVLCLWPAIRGKVGLRFYPKAVRFVSWVLILAVVLLSFAAVEFLNQQEVLRLSDSVLDVLGAAILSILMIIMGTYMLLSGRIDRGDLHNKTKMLELEYRLAELEEKLRQAPHMQIVED